MWKHWKRVLKTQTSKIKPRYGNLGCVQIPAGDYPKPFCHLVPWHLLPTKQREKKRHRIGSVRRLATPLLPRGTWKTPAARISAPSTCGKQVFPVPTGAQSWLFPQCPGEHNMSQRCAQKTGCIGAEWDPHLADAGLEVHPTWLL